MTPEEDLKAKVESAEVQAQVNLIDLLVLTFELSVTDGKRVITLKEAITSLMYIRNKVVSEQKAVRIPKGVKASGYKN